MRFFKTICLFTSAGILLLAVGVLMANTACFFSDIGSVGAANANITSSLTAGNLSVSAPGSTNLANVNLDSLPDTNGQATGVLSGIEVRDHRQSAPGWSVTVTCTDFSDGQNSIPVTKFTIEPQSVSPIGNSSANNVNIGTPHTFSSTFDPATIVSAGNNSGRGRFMIDTNLALEIGVATKPSGYSATLTETVT